MWGFLFSIQSFKQPHEKALDVRTLVKDGPKIVDEVTSILKDWYVGTPVDKNRLEAFGEASGNYFASIASSISWKGRNGKTRARRNDNHREQGHEDQSDRNTFRENQISKAHDDTHHASSSIHASQETQAVRKNQDALELAGSLGKEISHHKTTRDSNNTLEVKLPLPDRPQESPYYSTIFQVKLKDGQIIQGYQKEYIFKSQINSCTLF
jgi:hypothetical protein